MDNALPGMPEPEQKPRPRDALWDALVEAWGPRPPSLIGKVRRDLLATYSDVTPESIVARSREAQARWDDVTMNVLVTRWPDLAPKRDRRGVDTPGTDWQERYAEKHGDWNLDA